MDGEPTEIYRADYLFRGVIVSEGEHRIEFVYDPASFKLGVTISVVALTMLFGLWGFDRYRLWKRKKPSDTRPAE